VLLGTDAAHAHGIATGGGLAGLIHPLLGLDHLVMLMAVGAAASFISARLLLWALAGAVIGASIGFTGVNIPAGELLAALAISLLGGLILAAGRFTKATTPNSLSTISGAGVAAAVSIHAMLHGLEAPKDSSTLLWWSGALLSAVLVCGGTHLLLNERPLTWTKTAAIAFLAIGAVLAFGPLGALMGGAGA